MCMNVVVRKTTADELNAVVQSTNILRDAFINRLILLLRSSNALLGYLELPQLVTDSEFKSSVDRMPTSPMKAIEACEMRAQVVFEGAIAAFLGDRIQPSG